MEQRVTIDLSEYNDIIKRLKTKETKSDKALQDYKDAKGVIIFNPYEFWELDGARYSSEKVLILGTDKKMAEALKNVSDKGEKLVESYNSIKRTLELLKSKQKTLDSWIWFAFAAKRRIRKEIKEILNS